MKKLYTLLFLLLCITTYAGHELGSMIITYEPVPNQPLKYTVTLAGSYATTAIPPPSSMTLNISGACFSNFTASLNRVGGTGAPSATPGATYCLTGYSSNYTGVAKYQGVVTLPMQCTVVTMSISSGLGRFDPAQNIVSNYDVPYFYVKMYNTALGQNSSPQVQDIDFDQYVCTNKSVNLYGFTESDGDSLFFFKTTPLKAANQSFNWSTGYSQQNPLGAGSTFAINNSTGAVQISLPNAGNYLIPLRYLEYRYDSATSAMVLIGEGVYSFVINGTNTCSSPSSIGIHHEAGANASNLSCGSNTIKFVGTRKLARGSITSQGTEFEVISKKSGNLNVSSASLLNDSVVEITLAQMPPLNDTLQLMAKVGADNNVIISKCGVELTAYDDTLTYFTALGVQPIALGAFSSKFLKGQYSSSSVGDSIWWDFGDGSGDDNNIGSHSYSSPGTYNVTLTAFGACGTIDDTSYTVQVCDSISADFSYSQSGDTIYFSADYSIAGAIYSWNFGDGSSGSGDSVLHVYTSGVGYLAELIVSNVCGDTVIFSDSIATCVQPIASWTYTVVSTTSAGMTVDFDGTASTNANSFEWDFGDGATDNSTLTPRHLYQTPGLHYYVKLKVENSCQQTKTLGFRMDEIGVEEHKLEQVLSFYPNPVSEVLNLERRDDRHSIKKINVLDASGKEEHVSVTSNPEKSEYKISIGNLAPGYYILEVIDNKGRGLKEIFLKK